MSKLKRKATEMSIEWTDEQIERAAHAFKQTTEYDISPYSEDNYIHAMSAALAALAPDIEAHIAAEVDVRVKGLRRRIMRLEQILNTFLGADKKMQVAIGGNPIYVDAFLAKARAALAPQEDGECDAK